MADLHSSAVLPRLHRPIWDVRGIDLDPRSVITSAQRTICGSAEGVHCGLSLIPTGRAPETVAATDALAVRVDWLQHELQQGPAVRATSPGHVVASRDLAVDRRWPDFGRLCVAVMNLRSAVCIPIPLSGHGRGMLSFYADDPAPLGHLPMISAVALAQRAAPALTVLLNRFRAPLVAALDADCSRTAIAVNLLVLQRGMNASAAFNLLDRTARELHTPLLALVLDVIRIGELPDADAYDGERWASPGQHVGGPAMWQSPIEFAPEPV